MTLKIIVFLFLCSTISFSQTDWIKWDAAVVSYELNTRQGGEIISSQKNGSKIIGASEFVYKTFVSDLDGDNCPFYPSCSRFFSESVGSTNIVTGVLMFADRFTRDLNFFKSIQQYGLHTNGKFFDPVENYIINSHSSSVKLKSIIPIYYAK